MSHHLAARYWATNQRSCLVGPRLRFSIRMTWIRFTSRALPLCHPIRPVCSGAASDIRNGDYAWFQIKCQGVEAGTKDGNDAVILKYRKTSNRERFET